MDRSTDGGNQWGKPHQVSEANATVPVDEGFANFPSLGVNPSDTSKTFIVWTEKGTKGDSDVVLARCTATGDNITGEREVLPEPAGRQGTDQLLPWLSVAPSGKLAVVHYSRSGASAEVDAALQGAGPPTAAEPFGIVRVSDAEFTEKVFNTYTTAEYIGITADDQHIPSGRNPLATGVDGRDLFTNRVAMP